MIGSMKLWKFIQLFDFFVVSEYRGQRAVGQVLPKAGPGHPLRHLRVPPPGPTQGL